MKSSKIAWTLVCILMTNNVFASTSTWTGAVDSSWNTTSSPTNWNPNSVPSGSPDLIFPANASIYISSYDTVISGLTINSMVISSGGSLAYNIAGSSGNPIIMGLSVGPAVSISIDNTGMQAPSLDTFQFNAPSTTITSNIVGENLNFTSLTHMSGSGSVIFTSASPVNGFTLGANSAYAGSSSMHDTIVQLIDSDAFGSGAFTMGPNSTMQIFNLGAPLSTPIQLNGFSSTSQDTIIDIGFADAEISGVISNATVGNPRVLTKIGGGALTLSGTNTYSGGTVINEGALTITNNTNIGVGPLTFVGQQLTLNSGATSLTNNIFIGVDPDVGNPTDLTINSTGTTSFLGLIIGRDQSTLSLTGSNSISNIEVDSADKFVVDGVISGNSGLTKTGTGTLSFNQSQTYSGLTTISSGVIELNSPQGQDVLGSGPIVLDSGSTLSAAQNSSLSNSISLAGNATFDATNSNLNFFGNINAASNVITLQTQSRGGVGFEGTVSASQIIVGNSMTPESIEAYADNQVFANVLVQPQALLGGVGTVTGNVTNNGNIFPGTSSTSPAIGNMTIVGNYEQGANSAYNAALFPDHAALLTVDGTVTIDSGATFYAVLQEPEVNYTNTPAYLVIQSSGGVNGKFSSFISPSVLLSGVLSYPANQVVLTLSYSGISPIVTRGNGAKVALALDAITASGSTAVSGIISSLLSLNPSQLVSAVNQLQPSLYKGAAVVQENNSVQVRNVISERFQTILDNQHCYISKTDQDAGKICELNERKVNLWLTGIGDFIHQSSTTFYDSYQVGYEGNTGGFVTGVDYNFLKNFYLGVLGGYTHSNVNWQQNQGHAGIDSGYAGVYLTAIGNLVYGNLSVVGGWNHFDERRNIIYPGVSQTADNSHGGEQLISHLDTGLNFQYQQFTIRPFDSLDWIVQKEGGFTESNAGEYDLTVMKSHANMLRNELGINFAACRCFQGNKATFDTKFGWVHEARMSGKNSESEFAGTDVPFTTVGYFPNRNLFSFGASITAVALKDRLTCTIYYDGAYGHKYMDNGIGGQVNFGF